MGFPPDKFCRRCFRAMEATIFGYPDHRTATLAGHVCTVRLNHWHLVEAKA